MTGPQVAGTITRADPADQYPIVKAVDLGGGTKTVATAADLPTLLNVLPGDEATAQDTLIVWQWTGTAWVKSANPTLYSFGVKADRIYLTDLVAVGTNTFSSASYVYNPSDVGKLFVVYYENATNAPGTGTITAAGTNSITASFSAPISATGLRACYGTDDLAAMNAWIAAAAAANPDPQGPMPYDLTLPSIDVLISATLINIYGVDFLGTGRILQLVSNFGLVQVNSQYDYNVPYINRLALAAYQKKLSNQTTTSMIISGDSQVLGQDITDLRYRCDVLIGKYLQDAGFSIDFVTNAGHGGKAINDWFNQNITVGGTATASDVLHMTVKLPSGNVAVAYTVLGTEGSPTALATAFANAINTTAALITAGFSVTQNAAVLTAVFPATTPVTSFSVAVTSGGVATETLTPCYLYQDIPQNDGAHSSQDCYIINGWTANSARPDTNAPGNTVAVQIAILRAGLAYIRANWDQSVTSLILTMGSPCSNTPLFSDQKWMEELVRPYVQAALDFQSCFINTYQMTKDLLSTPANHVDLWFSDLPWACDIHPLEMNNAYLWSAVLDVIFHKGLQTAAMNNFQNLPVANINPLASAVPSTYPTRGAKSLLAARVANGFGADGFIETSCAYDGGVLQWNAPTSPTFANSLWYRSGSVSGGWNGALQRLIGSPSRFYPSPLPAITSSGGGAATYSVQQMDYTQSTTDFRFTARMEFTVNTLAAGNLTLPCAGTGILPLATVGSAPAISPAFPVMIGNLTLAAGYTQVWSTYSGTTFTFFKTGVTGQAAAALTFAELGAAGTNVLRWSGVISNDAI